MVVLEEGEVADVVLAGEVEVGLVGFLRVVLGLEAPVRLDCAWLDRRPEVRGDVFEGGEVDLLDSEGG